MNDDELEGLKQKARDGDKSAELRLLAHAVRTKPRARLTRELLAHRTGDTSRLSFLPKKPPNFSRNQSAWLALVGKSGKAPHGSPTQRSTFIKSMELSKDEKIKKKLSGETRKDLHAIRHYKAFKDAAKKLRDLHKKGVPITQIPQNLHDKMISAYSALEPPVK